MYFIDNYYITFNIELVISAICLITQQQNSGKKTKGLKIEFTNAKQICI